MIQGIFQIYYPFTTDLKTINHCHHWTWGTVSQYIEECWLRYEHFTRRTPEVRKVLEPLPWSPIHSPPLPSLLPLYYKTKRRDKDSYSNMAGFSYRSLCQLSLWHHLQFPWLFYLRRFARSRIVPFKATLCYLYFSAFEFSITIFCLHIAIALESRLQLKCHFNSK